METLAGQPDKINTGMFGCFIQPEGLLRGIFIANRRFCVKFISGSLIPYCQMADNRRV
jgi:hypothetical protein